MKTRALLLAATALLAVTAAPASAQSNFNCQINKNPDDAALCRWNEALPTRLNEQQARDQMVAMYGPDQAAHLGPGKLVMTGQPSFPGCPVVPFPMWYFVWDGQQDKSICGWCGPEEVPVTGQLSVETPCGPGTDPNNGK